MSFTCEMATLAIVTFKQVLVLPTPPTSGWVYVAAIFAATCFVLTCLSHRWLGFWLIANARAALQNWSILFLSIKSAKETRIISRRTAVPESVAVSSAVHHNAIHPIETNHEVNML